MFFLHQKINKEVSRGFTLVELIIYIAIASIMFGAIASFVFVLLESRNKNIVINEIEQQGLFALETITQTVRNAKDINTPALGTDSTSLSIDVVDGSSNPTVFAISNNVINITEGIGSLISLTNSHISATNISFKNLSRTDTPDIIKIQFTLEYNNPAKKAEFNYSKTFYGSSSVR